MYRESALSRELIRSVRNDALPPAGGTGTYMLIVFFLFWVILNGKITAEITVFGVVISAALYLFICKFMDYRPKQDLILFRKIPTVVEYLLVLIREIVKANLEMIRFLFHPEILAEPALVSFRTDLKSPTTRVLLANSITMTPGTITVRMEDGEYLVHCYDKSMGEGLDESAFVQVLRKLENHDTSADADVS